MNNYTQLTLAQRNQIEALIQAGFFQTNIANQLDVHRSTICRELKRSIALLGQTSVIYVTVNAERETRNRHKQKFKRVLFTSDLKKRISEIQDKWSPELTSKKWN